MVEELGYTGYERLRFGFNRAFGGEDMVPTFSLVLDAGCGTGLVGEQVSLLTGHDLEKRAVGAKSIPHLCDDSYRSFEMSVRIW